jgi:cold shock CspA family protein
MAASDSIGPKGTVSSMGAGRAPLGDIAEEAASVIELTGVIKWFDVSKGYGFIVPDNGLPDILLHVTCLRRDGFHTAYEGARVVVEVLQRPRGLQAVRVVSMDEATAIHPSQMLPPRTDATVAPTGGFERGQVKGLSFDSAYMFNALGDLPGFTIPVFKKENQFYLQNVVNGVIKSFDQVDIEESDCLIGPINITTIELGDGELVGFFTIARSHLLEPAQRMAEYFKSELEAYASRPFLFFEIAEFLGDPEIKTRARVQLQDLEAEVDPVSRISEWDLGPAR